MKKCTKCGEEKAETLFNLRGKGRLHSWCKTCFNVLTKAHYKANKDKYVASHRSYTKVHTNEMNIMVSELKEQSPCTDCGGYFHPQIMEYDHTSDNKHASVARLVSGGYSKEAILKEIAKCELVCANCHRMRTIIRAAEKFKKTHT